MLNTSKVGNLAFPRVGSTGSVRFLLQPEPNLVRFLCFLALINIIASLRRFPSFAFRRPRKARHFFIVQGKTLHINRIHGGLATAPALSRRPPITAESAAPAAQEASIKVIRSCLSTRPISHKSSVLVLVSHPQAFQAF
ncbi:hypothetical protein ASPVEDRAFT_539524 [Aspergillus versicolor CBS 583.65]|uniref:Uncharacterized protein n=1 Tax=Aspergillus versicolor CBS 583.65 TaxID=1036611 RepID=A0A1L9PES9_ASPVE|nr:uncharacterized protein ASPVEDRAFT_539524 [Aspergillus versicolor CBS 583.65]OJJ00003.1 hypothetical protein ASPVEDRAFT_539524 [Aspergillus versicolor CBS 583.65]